MFKVKVLKECSCFKSSDFESTKSFENHSDAYEYAKDLCDKMNDKFCSKHEFELLKVFDNYSITYKKPLEKALKCCGSGCCF